MATPYASAIRGYQVSAGQYFPGQDYDPSSIFQTGVCRATKHSPGAIARYQADRMHATATA